MPELIGRTLGQYRIIEQIGQGGMATVYKAYQPGLDREVALKILPPFHAKQPGFSERFQREARAIAHLHHPNILPVHDSGQDGEYSYLVMRYIDGARTLADVMRGQLTLAQVSNLIGQIASALSYAHQQGVIHRDVKPGNVLMDGDWVLLTDFGLAKMTEASVNLTGTGVGIGTPSYMSPEQGQGKAVDHRTDIYALGVILYEMLTGQIPHKADTPFGIIVKRMSEPLPLPSALNPAINKPVERVILKALATDPADRFDDAEAMAAALQTAIAGSRPGDEVRTEISPRRGLSGIPPAVTLADDGLVPPDPAPSIPHRQWLIVGGIIAAVIVAAGTFVAAMWLFSTVTPATPTAVVSGAGLTATPVPTATDRSSPTETPNTDATVAAAVAATRTAEPTDTPPPTATASLTATPSPTSTPTARPPGSTSTPQDTATPTATITPETTKPLGESTTGAPMVSVPAGGFLQGSSIQQIEEVYELCQQADQPDLCWRSAFEDESPQKEVYLDEFLIDKYEVTNRQYADCVNAGACNPPSVLSSNKHSDYYGNTRYANYPVIYVTWRNADQYCRWAGKRLPTEAEWEKAARGRDGLLWPWGNSFDSQNSNYRPGNVAPDTSDTVEVMSYSGGGSPYDAYDMVGNVWEWVADWYEAGYYAKSSGQNPEGPASGDKKVIRGGSWNSNLGSARSASRAPASPDEGYFDVGFRCAGKQGEN